MRLAGQEWRHARLASRPGCAGAFGPRANVQFPISRFTVPTTSMTKQLAQVRTTPYGFIIAVMTKDIVGKLKSHLSSPIDDEPKVVYLLAEVRKLLERDDPTHSNQALWMYCHWALHVDLSSPKATMDFLRRVDRWITNTVAYLTPSGPWEFFEEDHLCRDFIFLTTFRQQLRGFLKRYGLPLSLCDLDAQWYAFLAAYGGVIEDGALSAVPDKKNELGAVKEVTFTKGENLTVEHHVAFVIQWSIALNDGRTIRTSLQTVPAGGGNMIAEELEVLNGNFVPPPDVP